MPRFALANAGHFAQAQKITGLLTKGLGDGYHFDTQVEELWQSRLGRSGDFGRWLNSALVGDMTLIVSANPLFGTAVRFYRQDALDRTLVKVRGIIPHESLRKTWLPVLALVVMFGSILILPVAVGVALLLGTVPALLFVPRLLALRLTGRVTRLLEDAPACEAAGLIPPPRRLLGPDVVPPQQASQARVRDTVLAVLGLVVAVAANRWVVGQTGRPHSKMLWEDTIFPASVVAGVGLWLVSAGVSRWFLRRRSILGSLVWLVVLTGANLGAWALLAPVLCAPPSIRRTDDPVAVPRPNKTHVRVVLGLDNYQKAAPGLSVGQKAKFKGTILLVRPAQWRTVEINQGELYSGDQPAVSAEELTRDFITDWEAARKKYEGRFPTKEIIVEGVVTQVDAKLGVVLLAGFEE